MPIEPEVVYKKKNSCYPWGGWQKEEVVGTAAGTRHYGMLDGTEIMDVTTGMIYGMKS